MALSLNPKYAEAYNGRAVIRANADDLEGSLADYEKALELKPDLALSYLGRGLIHFQRGNLDRALTDLDRALELAPNIAKAYLERGTVRGLKGDTEGALADIRKGLSLEPSAASESIRENVPSPFSRINRFVADHPKNARAYQLRAVFRLLQGKKSEAERDFQKSLELDPKLKSEVEKFAAAFK
jgi:tetratricopeptide (TPR) repeat protein